MRIVVTGGRDFSDGALVAKALSAVHRKHNIDLLINGGARGADTLAANWARRAGIQVATVYADWRTHGKKAGILRNQQMLDAAKPDACVAFPGGRGTADMVARCAKAGLPVWQLTATKPATPLASQKPVQTVPSPE